MKGAKMQAAFLVGPRTLKVEEVSKPGCRSGTILVSMEATSICGSEIKEYRNPTNRNLPIVMGHETTGLVVEKSGDVKNVAAGERVVVQPAFSCGVCRLCSEGRDNICPDGGMMGRDKMHGGFA